MGLSSEFGGDDNVLMAVNNTFSFNFRSVTGWKKYSNHAYSWSIDLNLLINPYIKEDVILPP